MNIAKYVEIIDLANDKLPALIFKKNNKNFFVSNKFFLENKKELLIYDK